MLLFCLMGIIAACLTIFLNYCIGKPGSDNFSPHEIFSTYTAWLSADRLKKMNLYSKYEQQYRENAATKKHWYEVVDLKNDFRKVLYEAADPYFTWERAAGMCPVCTGVWVSLLAGTAYIALYHAKNFWTLNNFFNLLIIIVISHVTIRLLIKIL